MAAFFGGRNFAAVDGVLETQPGEDFGVVYYAAEMFGACSSGFRGPLRPRTARIRTRRMCVCVCGRPQWVSVHTGFEVQIDEPAF